MVNIASGRPRDQLTGVRYNDRILYCFKTASDLANGMPNVNSTDLQQDLGHIVIEEGAATGTAIGVLGANAPQPPRVSRRDPGSGRTISTFCASDKLSAALKKNWAIAKYGSTRGILDTLRRKSVYIELFGLYYVWTMPDENFNRLSEICGIKDAVNITTATEFQRVVAGTSRPRPGTVKLRVLGGGGGNTSRPSLSSFYDPAKRDDLGPLSKKITDAVPPVVQ